MDLARAVKAVGVAADWCAQADLDAADASVLRAQLKQFKQYRSRLDAQLARFTHAADVAGAFIGTGARDTAEWLGKETGTSTRENRSAAELGEAMSKSDELNDAVTSGRVSTDKAAAAVGALDGLPADAELIDEIADLPLGCVRPAAEQWRARTHADREADRAEAQRAKRFLRLTGQADGTTRLEGVLDFGRENRLVSENLFLALVARDQHGRWPSCHIRATWCDAHHVIEWLTGGRTDESTCALLCHFHHGVTHQPGWRITGDGHEFTIHHPDGSTEVSEPPGATPLRADPIGGTTLSSPARSPEQLVLA